MWLVIAIGRWTESLISFNNTLWYFVTEKRKSCKVILKPLYKSQSLVSDFIPVSVIRITLGFEDRQFRMIEQKPKWPRPSSLCNLYIIRLSSSPSSPLTIWPPGSCIQHHSGDTGRKVRGFYNEMPVSGQIRPLSYLSVSSLAPVESQSVNSGYMSLESSFS